MSEQSNKDRARSAAFGGNISKSEIVEFGGARYKVVKPSLKDVETSEAKATRIEKVGAKSVKSFSKYRQSAVLLVLTVLDPDTDKPVFEFSDVDAIMSAKGNDLFEELGKAARRLAGLDSEAIEGNSDGSHSGESSSA